MVSSPLTVGDEYELRCLYGGVESYRRVRIVSDNGRAPWIRFTRTLGNSFPVPRLDLRPVPSGQPESLDN